MQRSSLFKNSSHKLQFDNLITTNETIPELYRGFTELPAMFFEIPTTLFGFFCRKYPSVITIDDINNHKTTNLSLNYHFVGMSETKTIAESLGTGTFITIDPTLFRNFSVDVHASYRNHKQIRYNFPDRMEKEAEHVALAILYCSVKNIIINNKIIENPFYLSVEPSDKDALTFFSNIYLDYLNFLRSVYTQQNNIENAQLSVNDFVDAYLNFYRNFARNNNPFDLSIEEFIKKFPDYAHSFSTFKDQLKIINKTTNRFFGQPSSLGELLKENADVVFKQHSYIKNIQKVFDSAHVPVISVYDDPYACPVYD